jgi:hypothetical protein
MHKPLKLVFSAILHFKKVERSLHREDREEREGKRRRGQQEKE